MADPDNPALNDDGSYKDASEMTWAFSPSEETRTITLADVQKKRKRSDSSANEMTDTELPTSVLAGLRGKSPAKQVAGKRMKKLSSKGKAATAELSAQARKFFQAQFTVGSDSQDASSSTTTKAKAAPPKPKQPKGSAAPTKRRANSAPPSPEKPPRQAKKSELPAKRPKQGAKSTTSRKIVQSSDDDEADSSGDDECDAEETLEAEEDPMACYERQREEIQRERLPPRKHFHRGEDPRTQDLRAMFKSGQLNNTATGQSREGKFCCSCIASGVSQAKAFFTGDNSTLRTHIRRCWSTHGDMYLKVCADLQIQPNERCLPDPEDSKASDGTIQTSLDGFVQANPSVKWSKQGLLEHILEFVVSGDQSFRVVDEKPFRALLKYQRPSMQDSDIPHRTKLTEEIVEKANDAIKRIKEEFKRVPGKISITFDAWTSKAYDPYLAITAHYIDAPEDKPAEWELKSKLLGFEELKGRHGGANIAAKIVEVLDQYDIRDKLGWATADNATANDKALRVIQCVMPSDSVQKWYARDRRVRCMEHTVYLAAKAFIETVKPRTPRAKKKTTTKNGTASVEDADDEDEETEDDDWVLDWTELDNIPDDEEVDDVVDFEAGDVLGKTLALVNQIRSSSQAKQYFARCCESEGVPILELIKWVRTRWGSMYDLIERFTKCKAAVQKFCAFADDKLPKLKNKLYSDYRLATDEWTILELVKEVLEEPRSAQASFSSETEPTVWKSIPTLELLQKRWETMLYHPKCTSVHAAIEKGLDKIRKWYASLDESDTYFICLDNVALHPSIKLDYCKNNWDKVRYDAGYKAFKAAYDAYYCPPKKTVQPARQSINKSNDLAAPFKGYGANWILSSLSASSSEESLTVDPQKEFSDYVDSDREVTEDPVRWWGYHARQYPTLSAMARDYLAIQGSSVASERAFSSSGITDTLHRNRMETFVFGKAQVLKHAYKSQFLDAATEAKAHKVHDYMEVDN